MSFTLSSFTPSEYILLNGDKFAPETKGHNQLALLCSDNLVDGNFLASMIIAAVLLANEAENALTIELVKNRKAFGLKETTELVLRAGAQIPAWNGYTLESAILFISGQIASTGQRCTLQKTIYTLLTEDREKPWEKIIELVEWGLASSNWLMPVGAEAAAAFSIPFICPAKVRDLALAQPSAPIVELLSNCKKGRPEIWQQMMQEISSAFDERKL